MESDDNRINPIGQADISYSLSYRPGVNTLFMKRDQARRNLERLLEERGAEAAVVSRALGWNHAYLHQYIKKGKPRHLGDIRREELGRYFDVDPDFFRPNARPLPADLRNIESDNLPAYTGDLGSGVIEVAGEDYASLPRFDTALSAGPGSLVDAEPEPLGYHLLEMQWLRMLTNAAPRNLMVAQVDGDSMEPTLSDRDFILLDSSQRRLSREGIYALNVSGSIWVKRISLNLREGLIQVISDNPHYPMQELSEEALQPIGRALCVVARKL